MRLRSHVSQLRDMLLSDEPMGRKMDFLIQEVNRESNTIGISSRDLARCIPGSVYFETLPEVTAYLRGAAQKGDLILTVGAGDIYKAGEALLKKE